MKYKVDLIKNNIRDILELDNYKGYNPYDLLKSEYLEGVNDSKTLYYLSQLLKISPINFRPILKIKKTNCPKSLALILYGSIISKEDINFRKILQILEEQKINYKNVDTWGFDFPIMLSHYSSPKGSPSVVISLFVYFSLFEYYALNQDVATRTKIENFRNLLTTCLPKQENDEELSFSYVFERYNSVFNCTAKIGKLLSLCQKYNIGNNNKDMISKILNHLSKWQRPDGSWPYSEVANYSDSFHTAFILDSIYYMLPNSDNPIHHNMYYIGKKNYYSSFIRDTGQIYYYHPEYKPQDIRKYLTQTDIRDCAMAIQFSLLDNKEDLSKKILNWTIENMYSSYKHFNHYYEKFWNNNINYIRPQAWMYLSIAKYIHRKGSL